MVKNYFGKNTKIKRAKVILWLFFVGRVLGEPPRPIDV
jgi:hypothetical protein